MPKLHHYERIERIAYRDREPKLQREAGVVDLHMSNGHVVTLDNRVWSAQNPFLQLLAVYHRSPSDITATPYEPTEPWYIPVSEDGEPQIEFVLRNGSRILNKRDWFNPDMNGTTVSEGETVVFGGGSPDPGTGNRGGIDVESIRDELDDSDTEIVEV